ncbi:allantoinase AllB [Cellulomonas sp. 179-A 4D5 NHS]|uniref:allantoinase AllB n=1 Tax=Cellulomonas sp. 179-A 4D5 NHS TaxID=3142378 RepID=UPI0039A22790
MPEQHDLVVRAARALVDGRWGPAEVGVREGRVVAVSSGAGTPLVGTRTVTLADDEVLLPGLVDTHVHVNEPGRTHWEGFASATRAAAAGGVTTLVDMPLNSIPPTTDVGALTTKRTCAEPQVRVDVAFWGGAVPGNLGSLRALHDAGVLGFKAFLAPSGVEEFAHLGPAELDRALAEVAAFDGLLLVHAEDPAVLDAHAAPGRQDYARFVGSRPDDAEVAAIERLVAGVRRTGARAHVLHLSSAAALPVLRAARAEGLRITVETCPHYLTISAEQVPEGGTQFKCCPPIRDAANQDALWQALVDGDVDVVVTDHSPSTPDLKLAGGGDFAQAWGGIAGLQTGLAAVWTEAARRGIGLERVVGWMSAGPARLAGLGAKGRIAVGADADLVAFAPDAEQTVHAAELLHRNPVSAFDGRTLRGVVRGVWLRGEPVATGPEEPARGRLLHRADAVPAAPEAHAAPGPPNAIATGR